jgi:hypothetical protein
MPSLMAAELVEATASAAATPTRAWVHDLWSTFSGGLTVLKAARPLDGVP